MELSYNLYQSESNGTNILVLHGLFASKRNWVSVAEFLKRFGNVYAIDLRNHGDSPHTTTHSISEMKDDLISWVEEKRLGSCIVLGHSMGGLVAMKTALTRPDLVSALIVDDIAPREYPFDYTGELALLSTDPSGFKTRSDLEKSVANLVPDTFIRQFLMMNLERKDSGKYQWKINVDAIRNSRSEMFSSAFKTGESYLGKSAFIFGGDSSYFKKEDEKLCTEFFPNSRFFPIPGGGHYIHYTHFSEFQMRLQTAMDWILR